MKKYLFYFLGILPLFVSCEKPFLEPVKDTPRENFESLWKNYDLHYSGFVIKDVDWDSIYDAYSARINDDITDDQLFNLLSEMLSHLKDGHVWLVSDQRFYSYNAAGQHIYYYNPDIIENYLLSVQTQNMFTYGKLEENIGYFHISTFGTNQNGYDFIDNIISKFAGCEGIVIDVRGNGGGSENNAKTIAGRFYDQKRAYCYRRLRNGPSHNDFTDKLYYYAEPVNNSMAGVPVMLLTDRYAGSASEDFVLMMRVLPYVTIVGDYTTGNPGNSPVARELQNGWLYYTPTGLQYTMDDKTFNNVGIEPDIPVTDVREGRDLMIERALEVLK
jgi:hypothetical protein